MSPFNNKSRTVVYYWEGRLFSKPTVLCMSGAGCGSEVAACALVEVRMKEPDAYSPRFFIVLTVVAASKTNALMYSQPYV